MPTADDVTRDVVGATSAVLEQCVTKIRHCLSQLTEEQVWWRPHESMNSIGNLVLHLTGNVRQWIVSGIGGATDVRDRPAEFAEQGPVPKAKLLAGLEAVTTEANRVLARVTADEMAQTRMIQGFSETGWSALLDSVTHFKGHTQEIISHTRLQLKDTYQFHWQPDE